MSRDILVCMVRATEWRRTVMHARQPENPTWAGTNGIEVFDGETLAGIWVSTWGWWGPQTAVINPDPPDATSEVQMEMQNNLARIGLVWADAPNVGVDPTSSLADVLWSTACRWHFRPGIWVYPNTLDEQVTQSQTYWTATHTTSATKVEGQRRADGQSGFVTFVGSEDGGVSFFTWHTRLGMHAVVSVLVLLPEEA